MNSALRRYLNLFVLAVSDGRLASEEWAHLERFAQANGLSDEERHAVESRAEEHARGRQIVPEDRLEATAEFIDLLRLAKADGPISREERSRLEAFAAAIGTPRLSVDEFSHGSRTDDRLDGRAIYGNLCVAARVGGRLSAAQRRILRRERLRLGLDPSTAAQILNEVESRIDAPSVRGCRTRAAMAEATVLALEIISTGERVSPRGWTVAERLWAKTGMYDLPVERYLAGRVGRIPTRDARPAEGLVTIRFRTKRPIVPARCVCCLRPVDLRSASRRRIPIDSCSDCRRHQSTFVARKNVFRVSLMSIVFVWFVLGLVTGSLLGLGLVSPAHAFLSCAVALTAAWIGARALGSLLMRRMPAGLGHTAEGPLIRGLTRSSVRLVDGRYAALLSALNPTAGRRRAADEPWSAWLSSLSERMESIRAPVRLGVACALLLMTLGATSRAFLWTRADGLAEVTRHLSMFGAAPEGEERLAVAIEREGRGSNSVRRYLELYPSGRLRGRVREFAATYALRSSNPQVILAYLGMFPRPSEPLPFEQAYEKALPPGLSWKELDAACGAFVRPSADGPLEARAARVAILSDEAEAFRAYLSRFHAGRGGEKRARDFATTYALRSSNPQVILAYLGMFPRPSELLPFEQAYEKALPPGLSWWELDAACGAFGEPSANGPLEARAARVAILSDEAEAFRAYLSRFHAGRGEEKVVKAWLSLLARKPHLASLQDLRKLQHSLDDDTVWAWVREWDRLDVYQAYLRLFSDGRYRSDAECRIIDFETAGPAARGSLPAAQAIGSSGRRLCAVYYVDNSTGRQLTMSFSGPETFRLTIRTGRKVGIELPFGSYRIAASVPGNVKPWGGTQLISRQDVINSFTIRTTYSGFRLPKIPVFHNPTVDPRSWTIIRKIGEKGRLGLRPR